MILIHTIIVDKFNKRYKIGETIHTASGHKRTRAYKKKKEIEMKREKLHQRRKRERDKSRSASSREVEPRAVGHRW